MFLRYASVLTRLQLGRASDEWVPIPEPHRLFQPIQSSQVHREGETYTSYPVGMDIYSTIGILLNKNLSVSQSYHSLSLPPNPVANVNSEFIKHLPLLVWVCVGGWVGGCVCVCVCVCARVCARASVHAVSVYASKKDNRSSLVRIALQEGVLFGHLARSLILQTQNLLYSQGYISYIK